MGVNFHSAVNSPNFMITPRNLVGNAANENDVLWHRDRTHFAMSAISDCRSRSGREDIVAKMLRVLGPERLHQYGECGDGHDVPKKQYSLFKSTVQSYKFFLAFENTITEGYVTEKLFRTLQMGTVPVYYGAPDMFNITKNPCFINARNFKSPKALANYLIYLDENPHEYNKYLKWKLDPQPFTKEYLLHLSNSVPAQEEMEPLLRSSEFSGRESGHMRRRAMVCRLCNTKYLEHSRSVSSLHSGGHEYHQHRWSRDKIFQSYFERKDVA